MSDKSLTEAEWKKFSKGRNLKDAALLKALADLDKAKTPEAQLEALDEIEKQAELLRKASKSAKEVTSYLDDVDKALAKERKLAEAEAKKAAAAAAEGEEEESPDLLTTRMVPVLRAVPKGEVVHALIATAGKDTVVLVSRKTIGAPRRKLLAAELGASGGVKFIAGECIWEESAHTFVVQTQAAGLAKKIRAALLNQTQQRFKVRVRGEDPTDIDDDGEPAQADPAGEQAASPPAPVTAGPLPATSEPVPGELQARFEERMAQIEAAVLAALKAQVPDANKIRAVADFAREKGAAGNYKSAMAGLDQLDKLLAATPPAAPVSAAPPVGKVDYAKCRLAWEAARKKVQSELQKLEQTILDEYREASGFAEISARVRKLDTVLAGFDEDLSGTLDKAFVEPDAAQRRLYHQAAAGQIRKFLDRAANDPFIAELETNPFVPITAQATLVNTLATLAKLIA